MGWLLDVSLALLLGVAGAYAVAKRRPYVKVDTLVRVDDHSIGVLVDYGRHTLQGPVAPGMRAVLPLLQDVELIDRRPRELRMEGHELASPWHVPRLLVRARDGSSYWFERVSVQVAVDPARVVDVLQDTGSQDQGRGLLVHTHARAALRESLGALSAAEVLSPERRATALELAQQRIATGLAFHGIELVDVTLSTPSFDERWEQTIERRKVAEQQIESLAREAEVLLAGEEAAGENLRSKLELNLEKDRLAWGHLLEDLQLEEQRMQERQAEKLERLAQEHALVMAADRSNLEAILANLDSDLEQREASRAGRLELLEAQQGRQLNLAQAEWNAEERQLSQALTLIEAERELRLAKVRHAAALADSKDRLEAERELASAREAAEDLLAEARMKSADRVSDARDRREATLAQASRTASEGTQEIENFRAETAGLARGGAAAVRAALIQSLAGVRVEIAPRIEGEAKPTSREL